MADVIKLLPENLSNQIAAGEVVQRPASVVKELLENCVDAGAKNIKLIVKEGGKSLIQVIDNGKGMSETDARMCFERHATSKLKTTEDLFRIQTKGFRGEALAAIAAVAQVDLKAKTEDQPLGTQLIIEGGKVISQEACQCATGANFSVKNLFFNVPARRNFLKDDGIELKHMIEEFERVALAHPEITFSFTSNQNEIYVLPAGTLIQRILGLFGSRLKEKLVPIEETTPYLKIRGYLGKPDAAVKRRGVNYLFVNNRFIRSGYMHTAIMNAYADLIAHDLNPYYFVFLDLPPGSIDINIHPTKTEIKFEDERTVFMLLQSAAQRSLGKAGAAPSLEFDNEKTFDIDYSRKLNEIKAPTITVNPDYNPFKPKELSQGSTPSFSGTNSNWINDFEKYKNETDIVPPEEQLHQQQLFNAEEMLRQMKVFQLRNKYLIAESSDGLLIIDQQRAHERILYEHYKNSFGTSVSSQQELFPISAEYSVNDFLLLMELKEDLKVLGFDIEQFGKNTIVIHGTPADLGGQNGKEVLDEVLENYKLNNLEVKTEKRENLCRALAISTCIRVGKQLEEKEMKRLVTDLLNCENYMYTPSGKVILTETLMDDLDKQFRKK